MARDLAAQRSRHSGSLHRSISRLHTTCTEQRSLILDGQQDERRLHALRNTSERLLCAELPEGTCGGAPQSPKTAERAATAQLSPAAAGAAAAACRRLPAAITVTAAAAATSQAAPAMAAQRAGPFISATTCRLWRFGQRLTASDLAPEPPPAAKPSGIQRINVSLADLLRAGILQPGRGAIGMTYKVGGRGGARQCGDTQRGRLARWLHLQQGQASRAIVAGCAGPQRLRPPLYRTRAAAPSPLLLYRTGPRILGRPGGGRRDRERRCVPLPALPGAPALLKPATLPPTADRWHCFPLSSPMQGSASPRPPPSRCTASARSRRPSAPTTAGGTPRMEASPASCPAACRCRLSGRGRAQAGTWLAPCRAWPGAVHLAAGGRV